MIDYIVQIDSYAARRRVVNCIGSFQFYDKHRELFSHINATVGMCDGGIIECEDAGNGRVTHKSTHLVEEFGDVTTAVMASDRAMNVMMRFMWMFLFQFYK